MASSATRSLAAASSAEKSFDQGSPSRSTVSRASATSSLETVGTGLCGWARATIASFAFSAVSRLAYVKAMSPAMPSAMASSTRPVQRERGARRMKSSSMRCIATPLLTSECQLPVPQRLCSPGFIHLGVELPLRANDDARDWHREPEERAFALQDLGQYVPPAFVGAPAADGDPHAALDEREREAAGLLDHDPARAVADALADAVERGDEERLDRGEVQVRLHEDLGQSRDQRAIHRAGETRPHRRCLGHGDLPLPGARPVQRVEAMRGERRPLLGGLQRLVVREQRVAHELVGEHDRGFALASGERGGECLERRSPRAVASGDLDGLRTAYVDAVRREPDAQLLVTPQK